jgi:uncharacterized membrane protein
MYSKARVAGHPIHPMLIAFPVAMYAVTVVALIAHVASLDPFWYRAAMFANIAGVVMAGVAAIPGLIDLLSLPRRSSARVTGIKHAAFNVLALSLFAISAVLLYRNRNVPTYDVTASLVLSSAGMLSTLAAGWLGWTLVQTHHVGVKPSQFGRDIEPEDVDLGDEIAARMPPTYHETYRTTIRH